jgi:CrcB protein
MIALVFVGGALGASLRYVVDGAVQERWEGAFPLGTLVVNLTGAFLLGTLTGNLATHPSVPTSVRLALGLGLLGGYTTFSTLMFESFRLLREGAWRLAMLNMLGSTVLGMAAAFIGLRLGGL